VGRIQESGVAGVTGVQKTKPYGSETMRIVANLEG
jgi:hypothetical protein